MVKKDNSPSAAVCSVIRSRPKRIRRSGSRASLNNFDVKGSYVMKKVWLFEGINQQNIGFGSEDKLSDRDAVRDDWCLNHSWFLFTNLSYCQHCSRCTKRILPHRAAYKCTACKKLCHLKCAIKSEDSTALDKREDKSKDMDISEITEERIVPKLHSQSRNVARLRKQMLDEDPMNETLESTKKADLNASLQSQAKQKFTNMKQNIVKRCKSIKKKVQKKKKEPDQQTDNNNNTNDVDMEDRIQEEREAWIRSPVRTRLRARQAQLAETMENQQDMEGLPRHTNHVTERRRRNNSLNQKRSRVRGFLHDYELTVSHIRDRLDIVEEKIKQLETAVPTEMGKWKDLQQKYRDEDSCSQFDSIPVESIEKDLPIHHETCLKQLEVENNLPSVSSGTASDEIFLVKDGSTSSHELVEPPSEGIYSQGTVQRDGVYNFQEETSLPSVIPVGLRLGEKNGIHCHQTSTPLTDRDLGYFKTSKKHGTHAIKHTSITTIKLDPSATTNHIEDCEQEMGKQKSVLSPEQLGVKHFLKQRNLTGRKSLSPLKQNFNTYKSSFSGSSPMASSTFRNGDDSILASETSPFSFTFRHDMIDCSQDLYAKMLDESKVEDQQENTSRQNCSSNLSFTFRNDSQMAQTNENEDLPGYTRNHSFHTYTDNYAHDLNNREEVLIEQHHKPRCPNDIHDRNNAMNIADVHVQYTEALIHERPDSSMLTDRTSLTNVTRPTGDFINSFEEKPSKSKWANKDVFMFYEAKNRNSICTKKPKSPVKMDERGDGKKPPMPSKSVADRNFLLEAKEKLKYFHLRRSSSLEENVTVGVCLEKEQGLSDKEDMCNDCPVQEGFVKETFREKEQLVLDDMDKKNMDIEFQTSSKENTLHEFEKMEKLCQNESLEEKNSKLQRSKTSLINMESQIMMDCDNRVVGRSVSRTSSMESKCSAKYHFLHDKGMIKIDSPSLKLVSSSPGEKRKEYLGHKLFEEESSDSTIEDESDNESEIEEVCIDNEFRLSHPVRKISTDLGSEVTDSKSDDVISETDETSSQMMTEQQMLDDYLKAVDDGQETWDNVIQWMHKECDDAEGEELEAELKLMIAQGERMDYEDGEHQENELGMMFDDQQEEFPGVELHSYSENNQDESIYYSFQAQSEELRHLATQCPRNSFMDGYHIDNRNGDDDVEQSEEDDSNSVKSSSLMYTIIHGTVEDVEKLLNSDRTISESEIKESLLWAIDNQHMQITLLLLEDICKLIRAAEEDRFVEVYAAYSEEDPWDPVFVVLSKVNPVTVWDSFMGFSVFRKKCGQVSEEVLQVENNSFVQSSQLNTADSKVIDEVIKGEELHKHHSKIISVSASSYRCKDEGKELVKETCIVIECLLKGFIPFGEDPFPREIQGIPTDIREGFSQIEIPHTSQNSLNGENVNTKRSPIQDTNNNKVLINGCVDRKGIIGSSKSIIQNGSIDRSISGVPKMSEHLNGHAVRETFEVFDEKTEQSDESFDTSLYQVVIVVVLTVSVCVTLYDFWFVV